ncbi:MAG: hypothetical protein QXD62_00900 [Candidatus Woesearchaeota archaeon]
MKSRRSFIKLMNHEGVYVLIRLGGILVIFINGLPFQILFLR